MSPPGRPLAIAITLGLVGILVPAGSCTVKSQDQFGGHGQKPVQGNGHWVQDARLREIMAELDREHSAVWPQEIEDEYRDRTTARSGRAYDELEELAAKLSETARRIPDAVAHISMPEVDRRSFLAQAETLHDQADRLRVSAAQDDLDEIRQALNSIEATCDSCHRRFRDFAGPLPSGRES